MKAYKVVQRLKNGDKVSCLMPKETGLRATYMTHGEIKTVPEGMVFQDLILANNFAGGDWDEVWECEVDGMVPIFRVVTWYNLSIYDTLKKYKSLLYDNVFINKSGLKNVALDNNMGDILTVRLSNAPAGTFLATNIKLVKMIERTV